MIDGVTYKGTVTEQSGAASMLANPTATSGADQASPPSDKKEIDADKREIGTDKLLMTAKWPLVVADDDRRWNQGDLERLGRSIQLLDFIPVNSGPIIDSSGADAQ